MKIAIDIGYGDVKVVTDKHEFKFTNAIAFAGVNAVDYGDDAGEVFLYGDKNFFVGESALLHSPLITRNYQYLEKYAPLLVYKALKMAKIKPTDEIEVITGLSLIDFNNNAKSFGKRLSTINVNNEIFNIELKNITVLPQGVGIYIDYKNTHNITTDDFFAIIDIGYNTFDFLVFQNGSPIKSKCYANTHGVNTLIQQLQAILGKQFNSQFNEQEVKDFLATKSFRIGKHHHDISNIVQQQLEIYAEIINNEVSAKNQDILNRVFGIIISGGGAYLLKESNTQIFDHQIFSNAPYEFANVRGYFSFLKDK
jgi:plasmid segregation protein ParM